MLAARRLSAATSASTSPLLGRRLSVQTQPTPPPEATESGPGTWARRAVALSLLGLTGAVAASAVSDLSVFLSCSRSCSRIPWRLTFSICVSGDACLWDQHALECLGL